MQLTTRCPECGVCFDVSLKELQLRKGYVRCVQCANIFDGYEAVVPSSERKQTGAHPESAASPAPKPEKPFFHRLELPPISRPARSPASQLGGSTTPEPTIPNEPASAGRQEPVFTLSTHDADSQLPKTRSDLIRRGRPRHPDADSQEHQGRYSLGDAPTSLSDSRDTEEDREATAAIRFPRSTRTSSTSPIQSIEATDAFRSLPDDAMETTEEIYLPPRDPDNPVLPGFLGEEESEPSRGFRVVWWVLIIVGLFVLLAQLLFVYRVAIANYMP
ncbi:MAG TPA: MJ0042-type zinc finger domain-containing protein, partial [Burkholderiaceae bacterium]|nr:MJ0042-type zinc finger domain-containing protein [Burkholderiaceae bacterium]